MIIDGRGVDNDSVIEVDLCIIGAGPAGNVITGQLLNSWMSIAFIESGGLDWDEATQDLADGEVAGHKYFPLKETRIRALGGTTRQWAGVCAKISCLDFAERLWVPCSGWPLTAEDIEPYIPAALEFCGVEKSAIPLRLRLPKPIPLSGLTLNLPSAPGCVKSG